MNEATYCPEDNKLRLYCGRVPREEYEALRAAGYKPTPKQTCDFVATWSPRAEDAARAMLDEGDDIGDEDQGPEDRAADRAERFGGYRDKRRAEAGGHADTFEAGPSAHGYQDARKAERMAARHDRQRGRALTQWDKAEYWQSRTQGVIDHALYNSRPEVRRTRIRRLELELSRIHREDGRWYRHLSNRIAYERQMMAAQGGGAMDVEMVPGGKFRGGLILAVNKSPSTGAVVSVNIHSPNDGKWDYRRRGDSLLVDVTRYGQSAYTAPTPESLAELAKVKKAGKAKTQAANAKAPKLINPTDEDARRLQDIWNKRAKEPSEVLRMTQAQYSARSKGEYASCKPQGIAPSGYEPRSRYGSTIGPGPVLKVRMGPRPGWDNARRVIVLTDKPQKPIPWDTMAEIQDARPTAEKLAPRIGEIAAAVAIYSGHVEGCNAEQRQLIRDAEEAGLLSCISTSQVPWTDRGSAMLRAYREAEAVAS